MNLNTIRCNPIHENQPTLEYAAEIAYKMMTTLIYYGKRDARHELQLLYMAGCLQLLEQYDEGKFFTIPHLVELLNCDWRKVLALSEQYDCPAMPYVGMRYNADWVIDYAMTDFLNYVNNYREKFTYWLLTGEEKDCQKIVPEPNQWISTPILDLIKKIYSSKGIEHKEVPVTLCLSEDEERMIDENVEKIREDITKILSTPVIETVHDDGLNDKDDGKNKKIKRKIIFYTASIMIHLIWLTVLIIVPKKGMVEMMLTVYFLVMYLDKGIEIFYKLDPQYYEGLHKNSKSNTLFNKFICWLIWPVALMNYHFNTKNED